MAILDKTSESAGMQTDNFSFIILISCIATIGGFLFGFDSGVINGTVDGLSAAFNSDDVGTGFNVASMLLGCAIGAFFAGQLADRFGRRTLLLCSAVLFLISAWGSGIAGGSSEFVLFRLIGGLAVGTASILTPAYISEIAPARNRGSLATIQQVAIIIGLFSAFVSNYFLAQFAGASTEIFWWGYEAWRWMFWVELFPAALFLLLLLLIPESPRYLVIAEKTEVAQKVLIKLYGVSTAIEKLTEITESLFTDRHKPKLSDIFVSNAKKIRPIIWVGIGLATFQQLVGINVVFYYGAVLWQAVGFSESNALMINIISGAVSIFACLITIVLIDKIGRKPFLLFGSVGIALTLLGMVVSFSNATINESGQMELGSYGTLALVSANLYVFFFNMSWGPIMWVMLGEMFPNRLRGSGLAIAGLSQWSANFIVVITFPILLTEVGLAVSYSIYTFFSVVALAFVILFVNETKGIELEQMKG